MTGSTTDSDWHAHTAPVFGSDFGVHFSTGEHNRRLEFFVAFVQMVEEPMGSEKSMTGGALLSFFRSFRPSLTLR